MLRNLLLTILFSGLSYGKNDSPHLVAFHVAHDINQPDEIEIDYINSSLEETQLVAKQYGIIRFGEGNFLLNLYSHDEKNQKTHYYCIKTNSDNE